MNPLQGFLLPAIRFLTGPTEQSGPLEILVVEDCDEDAEQIEVALSEHNVHRAKTLHQAQLMLARMERLDAAYIDLNLKGGNGMQLFREAAVQFPLAKLAIVCGNAAPLAPGDNAMVIVKSARIPEDVRRHITGKTNGNGNGNGNGHVNHTRLFIVVAILVVLSWLAGELQWLEWFAVKLKQLNP